MERGPQEIRRTDETLPAKRVPGGRTLLDGVLVEVQQPQESPRRVRSVHERFSVKQLLRRRPLRISTSRRKTPDHRARGTRRNPGGGRQNRRNGKEALRDP